MKKKSDFKKLALMGITGGIMFASSASASQAVNLDSSTQMLAAGCGGKSGCANKGSVAYQPHSGCGNMQPQTQFLNDPNQNQGQPEQPAPSNGQGQPSSQGGYFQPATGNGQGQPQAYNGYSQWETNSNISANNKMANEKMTIAQESVPGENQLLSQLNDEGKAVYRGLDPAGKAYAIELVNNQKTAPNEAVKLAAQKMAEKRANMNMHAPKH